MSAWDLPITVQVAGRVFAIRSDFRAVLDALAALADPDLTRAHGKMLDKSEQEFARENAAIIKIHAAESAEDKAEKERLLDLLGR